MTETFAIISNNQNNIMALALVTIVMSVPTMIFPAYGMNFKDNENPLWTASLTPSWLIVFTMSVSLTLYLIHKKMVLRGIYVSIDLQKLAKRKPEFIHIAATIYQNGKTDAEIKAVWGSHS